MTFSSLQVALVVVLSISARSAFAAEWRDPSTLPPVPEAVSSFGLAIEGNHLYSFSGHIGRIGGGITGGSLDALSPHFCRLDLSKPGAKWEDLAMREPSQSPGLVGWKGSVYRVGGLSFTNKAGDKVAYRSLDIFAKYDPTTNKWTDLPALPQPRSSFDAAVLDGKLYVVGGWNMQGDSSSSDWHKDAVVFDLSNEKGSWKTIAKPPFAKRGLAVAGHAGKIFALGGMTEDHEIVKEAHTYDPAADRWTAIADIKGFEQISGFSVSAYSNGTDLYYSGSDGIVYRLDGDKGWAAVERLMIPRSFHRLVATKDQVLVVAGVARGGTYLSNLEVVDLTLKSHAAPKLTQWSVPFAGEAKQAQNGVVIGSSLYLFGGNRSRAPHDFKKEMFSNKSFRFDVGATNVVKLADLPQTSQSGAAVLVGSRFDGTIHNFGGLGPVGDSFASIRAVQGYKLKEKSWSNDSAQLPVGRSMFRAVEFDGQVWMFGGSETRDGERGLATEVLRWSGKASDPIAAVPNVEMPISRRSFGGTRVGDSYYLVGGLGPDSKVVAQADVFNLKTQKWSTIPSPQTPRVFAELAAVGDTLYLSGGFAMIDGHFQPVATVEAFDLKAGNWKTFAEKLPIHSPGMSLTEFQGRLLFYGVDGAKDGVMHFALLDPTPDGKSPPPENPRPGSGNSAPRGNATKPAAPRATGR